MDYHATIRDLGTKNVTATFGCAPPQEVVGPIKPKAIHYGVAYPSDPDNGNVLTNRAIPLLHMDFNKYRPDLPPWRNVREIVLASRVEGKSKPIVASFIDPSTYGIQTTANLKTVTIAAEGPSSGTGINEIVTEEAVMEHRERLGV